jgi:hypothetical protein
LKLHLETVIRVLRLEVLYERFSVSTLLKLSRREVAKLPKLSVLVHAQRKREHDPDLSYFLLAKLILKSIVLILGRRSL